jgi:hypothetical protein
LTCLVATLSYHHYQIVMFGSVEYEDRHDQIGLGADAATGIAPCDRFGLGSQLPVVALRA